MTSRACVVVPTRGTSAAIDRIATNIAGHVGEHDLLVVLNGTDEAELTRSQTQASAHGLRTVRCPGGGVARARNHALTGCEADIVIYVDDDVIMTTAAVEHLISVIAGGAADVATARVLPAQLDREDFNAIYDTFLGFDRGTQQRSWRHPNRLSPFSVWDVGVGALFAINRPSVVDCASVRFDERLSNGRWCGGTEDVDFFLRAFHAGLGLAYEPEAVAFHLFPDDGTGMRRKCRQYALTDGAFYAKWCRQAAPADLLSEVSGWVRRLGTHTVRAVDGRPGVPLASVAAEPFYKLTGAAAWWLVLAHRSPVRLP
jgi:glycosyltransferase involved in cell wall biosynthesis